MTDTCAFPGCPATENTERIFPCYETLLCMNHGVQANRVLDAKYGEGAERDWTDVCRTVRAWIAQKALQRGAG